MKTFIAFLAGTSIALTALAGCTPSPDPSPTPTPTPTPTELTPTPTLAPVPTGRNPAMSPEEALLRASRVVTGETWLAEPLAIDPPAWSIGIEMFSNDFTEWHQVGTRGDASIVKFTDGPGWFSVFEEYPSGDVVHVVEPSPFIEPPPNLTDWFGPTIVSDGSIYYDSLATPATFTTPEAYVLSLRDLYDSFSPGNVTMDLVGTAGNVEIYRIESEIGYLDSFTSPAGGLQSADVRHVAYAAHSPLDVWMPLIFDPLGLRDGSAVIDAATITVDPGMDYVDLFDLHCMAEPLYQVLVLGQSEARWTLVGSTTLGPLYAPTPANPVAIERHATYVDYLNSMGEDVGSHSGAASVQAFISEGALLGTPSPDGRGWFVQLSREFSPRAWC